MVNLRVDEWMSKSLRTRGAPEFVLASRMRERVSASFL